VTSAGFQAVFLLTDGSAETAAAEQQLMMKNDSAAEATYYSEK